MRELQDQKQPQDHAGGTARFEGAIPAIVDEETWQTVQKIRGNRAPRPETGRTPPTA